MTGRRKVDDERALDVELTDAGRELRTQALRVPGQIVARLGMDIRELESIRESLTRLLAAASTPDGAAPSLALA